MHSQINNLSGLQVLVTRPEPQGNVLCEKIRALDGIAIYFPTLKIIPLSLNTKCDLNEFDWLVFISPQSVLQFPSFLKKSPLRSNLAAIGLSTATLLEELDWPAPLYPKHEWSAEGLLKEKQLQDLKDKKIAIFKGEGGRDVLQREFANRGAQVSIYNLYRRELPNGPPQSVLDLLQAKAINVIICTSTSGLQNLKKLLETVWPLLQKITLIVVSERIKQEALTLGFEHIVLANNASDDAILKVMSSLRGA